MLLNTRPQTNETTHPQKKQLKQQNTKIYTITTNSYTPLPTKKIRWLWKPKRKNSLEERI